MAILSTPYPGPGAGQGLPPAPTEAEPAVEGPAAAAPVPARSLLDLDLSELGAELLALGAPAYRARQLFRGLHRRHARAWGELSDVPAALRERLAARFRLEALELRVRRDSADGTAKLLLAAADGQTVETVLIPTTAGRLTVCVSSQAGCALACAFCATGQMGLARNLRAGEILEQVYWAEEPGAARRVDNVVFMGMGEPLANYAQVVRAIRILADPLGYGFSPRRVTVSTSGLVPQMQRLATEGLEVRLAVSLHAPDDALRSQLMPINRRYPIAEVVAAAAAYAERVGRRVSYEYVMLRGVNDGDAQATVLAQLLHGQRAHVNLIPYNETASGFTASPPDRIRAFAQRLRTRGVPCTIRASRGQDIAAACGQLKAEVAAHRLRA